MSSSMLAGERKWATARKGGMTVLGKVTVPKPLNLPSQRLENHGMDPNVAIVPKGTLGWGSRGSSSSSDAKNSSVSSNADGGIVSSSHRPSSGGTGTRPSTAGSDRTPEPISSAWGSSSRPSSATGTYPSNQTPSSSRPRSAETRPNSSQLSRFAEPIVKNSVASERLGVKQDGFSLNSGDFPTLGADRVDSVKNIEYEDRSRPTSASGTSVQPEKNPMFDTDAQRGSFGTWRTEDSQGAADSIHPNMDKWQGDPIHYLHSNVPPNVPPQHFDPWYGPPMNVPDGRWDRGHPRAPQFRPPVGPNGYPMEPFPYYRPQMPPPPHLAGSLPVPPPGAAPRGPHPTNGDLYRPHVHDTYARPGMSYRPGFYHGPRGPMPFEGYYGPHVPYRNNEQDISFMGMGAGHHPAYDGYPRPGAPNLGHSQGRTGGYSPSRKMGSEKVEADYLEDSQQGKRVPQGHGRWNQKMAGENWEDTPEPSMLYPRNDYLPPMRISEVGVAEQAKENAVDNSGAPSENLESIAEDRSCTAENTKLNSFKVLGKVKAVKESGSNKSEKAAYFPAEMSQVHQAGGTDSPVPSGTKDPALMQKIEGLNAKIRVSDVRDDASIMYNIEDQRNRSQIEDRKIDDHISEVNTNASESFKKAPILGDVPVSHESFHQGGAVPRRFHRDGHGGDSYRGKGKFNSQGTDGWRRKTPHTGSSGPGTTSNTDFVTVKYPSGYKPVAEVFENSPVNEAFMNEGDVTDSHDESTIIQRLKMKELAKQRALQRQKEEEERAREQKAKAFAKLEELNRRTLPAGDSGHNKPEDAVAITQNQEKQSGSEMIEQKFSQSRPRIVSHSDVTYAERNTNQAVEFVEDSRNLSSEMQKTDPSASEALHLPASEDSLDGSAKQVALQPDDDRGISMLKPARHEQNQKVSPGTSLIDKSVPAVASEAQKDHIRIGTIDITLSEGPIGETRVKEHAPNTSSALVQPPEPQRKKNNHIKNRNKLDVTSTRPISPVKNESDKIESGSSASNFESSVQMGVPTQEVSSPPSKNRVSNQQRTQPSRRLPRGQQANRSTDKLNGNDTVMWAPVRTHTNKAENIVAADKGSSEESANQTKVDIKSENIFKGKRADMERYVTKAVVKELSQQETVPASSLSSSRSNEGSVKEQPSLSVKAENSQSAAVLVTETIESDGGRYNRRKKEHEVRRQWIAADSSSHTEGGGHLKPGSKNVELSKEQNESMKAENLLANLKSSEGSHTSSDVTTAALSKNHPGKDQGMGRGKRQLHRGSRAMGYNPSPENIPAVDIEGVGTLSVSLDVNRTEKTLASKEIQKSTERSYSHWKPKSISNSDSRISGSVSVAVEVNQQLAEKDHVEAKANKVSKHDKEIDKTSKPKQVEAVESKAGDKEKKLAAQSKSTPFPPNQGSIGPGDTTEDQLEHDGSSGFMKHRSQSNRGAFRGYESRRDWSSSHEFRSHNAPQVVRERQRQNTHYEYQPVDPSKSTRPGRTENPPPEGTENLNRRYQDRGPSHSKRGGNYYRHQSGAARVDSGHD